jgi:hypothetical protein
VITDLVQTRSVCTKSVITLLVMEVSVPSQWSLYLWWKCLYQASDHSTCDGSVCTKPVVMHFTLNVYLWFTHSLKTFVLFIFCKMPNCICEIYVFLQDVPVYEVQVSLCFCLELYNFSIRFCNCSDSVVFIFYHFITSLGSDCRLCTSTSRVITDLVQTLPSQVEWPLAWYRHFHHK